MAYRNCLEHTGCRPTVPYTPPTQCRTAKAVAVDQLHHSLVHLGRARRQQGAAVDRVDAVRKLRQHAVERRDQLGLGPHKAPRAARPVGKALLLQCVRCEGGAAAARVELLDGTLVIAVHFEHSLAERAQELAWKRQ